MIRALLEFLFVVVLAMVARAILVSVLRGVQQAGANAYRQTVDEAERRRHGGEPANSAGVLHKDPVCGTFVPESTPYRFANDRSTIYFCSKACREAWTPVPR